MDGRPCREPVGGVSHDAQYAVDVRLALELSAKFKTFFAGLTFAMLSFIGTHPITTDQLCLKILEVLSLLLLLIAGVALLIQLANGKEEKKEPHCQFYEKFIRFLKEKLHWWSFVLGLILLFTSRSILLFITSSPR